MAFMLYSFVAFFVLLAVITLHITRTNWTRIQNHPFYQNTVSRVPFLYQRLPDSTSFADDAAAGLHSSNFDLSGNIEAGDSRRGLDERAKAEVQRMMKSRGVGFDEARSLVVQERFKREGIGADGIPRDKRFVSFSTQ